MAGKNKGGREARKPKAARNQKVKGQPAAPPPAPVTAVDRARKPER